MKKRSQVSMITYPYNPLDTAGWHGDLAPVRLNVRDIRPIISHRYHLPPSVHTTFLADRFVVCTLRHARLKQTWRNQNSFLP